MDEKEKNKVKTKAKKGLFVALGSLTIALSAMKLNKNITSTINEKKERKAEITKVLDKKILNTELGEFHYIDLYNVITNKNQYIAVIGQNGNFYDVMTGNELIALDEKIISYSSFYEDIYKDVDNDKIKLEDVNQENIINTLTIKNSIADNSTKRRV